MRGHWPFGFQLNPQFSPFPHADERLVILTSFMARSGKSEEEIEITLWAYYRELLIRGGPYAIGVVSLELVERLITRFQALGEEAVLASLNILSRTARMLGTTEDLLLPVISRCMVCAEASTMELCSFRYSHSEKDFLPFGICDPCKKLPDLDSRLRTEVQYLVNSGMCLRCAVPRTTCLHGYSSAVQ